MKYNNKTTSNGLNKILISILSIIIVFVIFSQISFAVEPTDETMVNSIQGRVEAVRGEAGYAQADKYSIINMISLIIQSILSLLGIIFLVLILISGFQWMMSNGNEEIIGKAKDRIKNSIIGLAIVVLSFSISVFVFSIIPSA
jgi:hypothetical protein